MFSCVIPDRSITCFVFLYNWNAKFAFSIFDILCLENKSLTSIEEPLNMESMRVTSVRSNEERFAVESSPLLFGSQANANISLAFLGCIFKFSKPSICFTVAFANIDSVLPNFNLDQFSPNLIFLARAPLNRKFRLT